MKKPTLSPSLPCLTVFCLLLLLSGLARLDAASFLERFDQPNPQGTVSGGAKLALEEGLEKGALQVAGLAKAEQQFYSYDFKAQPGQRYCFSFNYRSTGQLPNNCFQVKLYYYDETGEELAGQNAIWRLSHSNPWRRRQFENVAPDHAFRAKVSLNLYKVPQEAQVWIDNFCLEPIESGLPHKVNLTNFETTFDNWNFDAQPLFEHFMIRSGKIIHDWQKAKVGEAYFEAYGDSSKMQYALSIETIRVKPNHDYIFQAWLQATESFAFAGNGIIIFFFRDLDGNYCKPHSAPYLHIRPSQEWTAIEHGISTPENCAFIDIGLNMRSQPETSVIRLDHLRFFQGEDKIMTQFEIDPEQKSMLLNNLLIGSLRNLEVDAVNYKIKAKQGDFEKEFAFKNQENYLIDLAQIPDGLYALSASVRFKNGQSQQGQTYDFGVYNNPDWTNDIAVHKAQFKAPAPWSDLQYSSEGIKTWNNHFVFADNLQLQRIDNLLAQTLSFEVDNVSVFQNGKANWQHLPSLGSASLPVQGKNWNAKLSVSVDYIGYTQYELKITAVEDCSLESASVTAKLNEVDFINRNDGSWTNTGAIDLNSQPVFVSKHLYNAMQFGNLDQGLTFYVESIHPSVDIHENECLRAGKDGVLSIKLINLPLHLKQGEQTTLKFAFAPYPYRPAEHNFRRLRFRASPKYSNFDLLWQTSPLMKYCGSLMEPEDLPGTLDYLKKSPELTLIYQGPTYIMEFMPQWSYFAKKWRAIPHRAYPDIANKGPFTKADFRQRSWQDLYIKTMLETMRKVPWKGVYYDVFGMSDFLQDGKLFKPLTELKAFHERVYIAQRINDPASFTLSHSNALSTLSAYSNAILTGEQHRASFLLNKYYQEFISLDVFRYENAVNIGADWMLLPQYRHKENVEDPYLSAHIMGMATLHNMMIYPNFIRQDIDWRIRDRQYEFDMNKAEFYPYWKENPDGMHSSDSEVKISYWKNPEGCFITVFNNSPSEKEFYFKTGYSHRSAEYFEPIDNKVSKISELSLLRLPAYNPAYITLRK